MKFSQAHRISEIQPPIIPIIHKLISENPETISLGQGVVYYGPPKKIAAGISEFFSKKTNHRYGLVSGIPELKYLLQSKLEIENKITLNDECQLVVTAGSNMGFMNALLSIANQGDEIILFSPYYFNHEMAIRIANCHPVIVNTDNDFQINFEAIKKAINKNTKAIVSISPNNPTGAVYPSTDLILLNQLCADRGIYHIHDEAYEYFSYEKDHFSPGSIPDSKNHTISLFSLSKSYGFAGWRIGYMVIPANIYEAVSKIQDTILICPTMISQYAAASILQVGSDYCIEKRKKIEFSRKIVLKELKKIEGLCKPFQASGAFYIFLQIESLLNSMQLTKELICQYKVAVLPGTAFGVEGCSIRLSYGALSLPEIKNGIKRLVNGIIKLT